MNSGQKQFSSKKARQRVLLIDDQMGLGAMLQVLFGHDQILLEQVPTAQQGLAALQQQAYDLLLLDLGLPDQDGAELLREIKSQERLKAMPVVILTGHHDIEHKVRIFDLGASDYVTKPFHPAELRARVNALLRAIAAENANKLKSAFLAQMSHDLRTPMNGIIASSELLLSSNLNERQLQLARTIRQSSECCLNLVSDILDDSKMEAGKLELDLRPFNLRAYLEQVVDLLAPKAAEKHLDLVTLIPPEMPGVLVGDVLRFRQIMLNLVANALKFTSRGEVCVEVAPLSDWAVLPPGVALDSEVEQEKPDQYILFRVRDTGLGIMPEVLPKLFNSYAQGSVAITRQFGGTGLGLCICKNLVLLLGGAIWAESTPGQGSVFSFFLPKVHPHWQDQGTPHAPPAVPGTAGDQSADHLDVPFASRLGGHVLILEDGAASRAFIEQEVRIHGFAPVVFGNSQAALQWLRNNQAVCAIIDDNMPEANGTLLAREIRHAARNPALPVALLGFLDLGDQRHEGPPPPMVMLNKPVKSSALSCGLRRLLDSQPPKPTIPSPPASPNPSMAEEHPLRILLADDNDINRRVGLSLLQQLGYTADLASDGREVLTALSRKHYDLLLLDMQMRVMDGSETARHIREREAQHPPHLERPPQRPLVILAVTANAMPGDRQKYLAMGLDDYISKPIMPAQFQATLGKWVKWLREPVIPAAEPVTAGSVAPVAANGTVPDAEPVVVDLKQFKQVAGTEPGACQKLAQLYLEHTAQLLEQLRVSLTVGCAAEVIRIAHNAAGASGTCGMMTLARPLREIQRLSDQGQISEALPQLEIANCELERVRKILKTV
ncbi:MAG: response regulator [Verrucomicrobiota bacterium]